MVQIAKFDLYTCLFKYFAELDSSHQNLNTERPPYRKHGNFLMTTFLLMVLQMN